MRRERKTDYETDEINETDEKNNRLRIGSYLVITFTWENWHIDHMKIFRLFRLFRLFRNLSSFLANKQGQRLADFVIDYKIGF